MLAEILQDKFSFRAWQNYGEFLHSVLCVQVNEKICMQVNEICVPYAVLDHGMHCSESANATNISELFIKAITHNEQRLKFIQPRQNSAIRLVS